MNREAVNLYEKRIKKSFSRISAGITDATDLNYFHFYVVLST